MFAYFLIAVELLVLYLFVWHYFFRDSKQYKVNGPLWGVYEDHVDELSTNADRDIALIFSRDGARFVDGTQSHLQPDTRFGGPKGPRGPRRPRRPGSGSGHQKAA